MKTLEIERAQNPQTNDLAMRRVEKPLQDISTPQRTIISARSRLDWTTSISRVALGSSWGGWR